MRVVPVMLIVFAAGCVEDTQLTPCGLPCYSGPPETRGIGACATGIQACDNKGNPTTCDSQTLPSKETCDKRDNDCDGLTDYALSQVCETVCGFGVEHCEDGVWVDCSAGQPKPETCNRRDDDCDGVPDNNLPLEFCYTGPEGSVPLPPCHPGYKECQTGVWSCVHETIPQGELCDRVDNDCNGIVDDLPPEVGEVPVPVDVVVIVDRSGSMADEIYNIQRALSAFVAETETSTNGGYNWWLFDLPGDRQVDVVEPNDTCHRLFSNPLPACSKEDFTAAVGQLNSFYGGTEPSWDALITVLRMVDWTPGAAHYVLLFTDEQGQSTTSRVETNVVIEYQYAAMQGLNVAVDAFVAPEFREDFDDITYSTGGQLLSIYADWFQLTDTFRTVLVNACG